MSPALGRRCETLASSSSSSFASSSSSSSRRGMATSRSGGRRGGRAVVVETGRRDAPGGAVPELPDPARDGALDRRGTMSRKWDRFGDGRVPLWVADMDFSAPGAVVDAVRAVAESGVYGYGDPDEGLEEAVRKRWETKHGVERCERSWTRWLPGLNPGLNHAVRAAGRARGGRETTTAVCTPIYPPFLYASRNNQTPKVEVPLRATPREGEDAPKGSVRYEVDWEALEAALKRDDVGLLLWCNPHNPVGRVWTKEEMTRVAKLCVEHDVILVSDEVWRELILDEERTPFTGAASLIGEIEGLRERVIVMTSPSKTFNVAGCDVAIACVPDKALRLHFARAGSDKAEITPFGLAACKAAYTDDSCEVWRQRLLAYLKSNRDRVIESLVSVDAVDSMGTFTVPDASYLLWLNCERLVDRVERSPFDHFLSHGVALSDGAPFSAPLSARVNYATRREILDQGLARLEKGLTATAPTTTE